MRPDFHFDWVECSVVAAMLLLSGLVGVYYTFFKKQNTYNQYMFGNKSMGVFPVATSVVVSFISAITIVGTPVEIYLYGTQFVIALVAHVTCIAFIGVFILPVFYKLQLASMFEYLELRFNRRVRIIGTILCSLYVVIMLPSYIYAPSLVINQVTGIFVHMIAAALVVFCLCYTTFGGLKSVVWTDTVQCGFMLAAVVVLAVLGCSRLGGLQEILRINEEGTRLELLNMDPSPFTRGSCITFYIRQLFLYLLGFGLSPGMVQRYLAVSSLTKARLTLVWTVIGNFSLVTPCVLLGLVLYARYHQCDPVASGELKTHNQLVPLYLMEVGKDYPGLAGLFLAGVISAALSTISSWFNTVAGTLYRDVMDVIFPKVKHSETKQSNIIRSLVVILGIISCTLVFIVEKLGSLLQMNSTLMGIVQGAITCLFALGMFSQGLMPSYFFSLFTGASLLLGSNGSLSNGASAGAVVSLATSMWITFNAQYYLMQGKIQFPGMVTSIDHCPPAVSEHYRANTSLLFTYTGVGSPVEADSSVPLLYTINFFYYNLVGTICGVIVGVVVSLLTEHPDYEHINPDVFSPFVHRFLPSNVRRSKEDYILSPQKNEDQLDRHP